MSPGPDRRSFKCAHLENEPVGPGRINLVRGENVVVPAVRIDFLRRLHREEPGRHGRQKQAEQEKWRDDAGHGWHITRRTVKAVVSSDLKAAWAANRACLYFLLVQESSQIRDAAEGHSRVASGDAPRDPPSRPS